MTLEKRFSIEVPLIVLVFENQARIVYCETMSSLTARLKNEFKDNKALFVKPLTAIVTGLKSVAEFEPRMSDSCQLEIIGGNHRRAALQDLYQETKDEQFKWANVLLFCGKLLLYSYPNHLKMSNLCYV